MIKEVKQIEKQLGVKMGKEDVENAYRSAQEEKIKKSSICCFSMEYGNTIMWSHYSDNHRGICLIFDISVNDPFEEIDPERLALLPVDYKNYSPLNYLAASRQDGIKKLFGTKSKDWEYEKEYRMVILEDHGLFRFRKEFLTGIIFGMRLEQNQIDRFISICERKGYTNLKYGQMQKEKLKLTLKEI